MPESWPPTYMDDTDFQYPPYPDIQGYLEREKKKALIKVEQKAKDDQFYVPYALPMFREDYNTPPYPDVEAMIERQRKIDAEKKRIKEDYWSEVVK